jgi:hypothetical protein
MKGVVKISRNICITASYLWQEDEACRTGVEVAGQKSWDVPLMPFTRVLGHDNDYRQLIPLFSPVLKTNARLLLHHPVAVVQVPTPYLLLCRHSNRYNRSLFVCSHGRPRQGTGVLQPAGLLYGPLWTFQLWPPDALAPTDAFRTLAAEVGTYGWE